MCVSSDWHQVEFERRGKEARERQRRSWIPFLVGLAKLLGCIDTRNRHVEQLMFAKYMLRRNSLFASHEEINKL